VSRVALLDVNVLVALFDPDHVHHELAHDWFASEGSVGWATCPLTENGLLRVLSNPAYHDGHLRPATLAPLLERLCAQPGHVFWDDTVSLCDSSLFDLSLVRGHAQLADVYLLGLAHKRRGCLATFDRSIPHKAVIGASRSTLLSIEPA